MALTPLHRKKDAIRFKRDNGDSTHCIIGGLTPWPTESSPPAVPVDATTISDAVCALKATIKWLREDDAGTIVAQVPSEDDPEVLIDQKFSELVSESAVLAYNGSIFIMMFASLLDDDIPAVSFYRKIGWSTDLVTQGGYENAAFVAAVNVSTWGQIELLEYRKPYPTESGSRHNFYQILQY